MKELPNCLICGSQNVQILYEKNDIPVFAHKIAKDKFKAAQAAVGKLKFVYCHNCGFIFNAAFEKERVIYDDTYDNSQDYSDAFHTHQIEVEKFITDALELKKQTLLEIGCGKGGFLKQLITHHDCTGIGFDPSYQPISTEKNDNLHIFTEYFGPESYAKIEKPVHLVIWRHVLEHINKPLEALKDIVNFFETDDNYYLYIETPDAQWIIENHMVYDFVYEHCSIFTLRALEHLLNTVGLEIVKYQKMFRGQYLAVLVRPKKISKHAKHLCAYWSKEAQTITRYLKQLQTKGAICVWGAGAKGIMFCNIFDADNKWVNCLIDINPHKQGSFAAHTAHPILAPEEALKKYTIGSILVLNSNYIEEISKQLQHNNSQLNIIDFEEYLRKTQLENIL